MEQNLNQTPRADRIHIGFFGRRNAGKSSLVNAITGQLTAIVSEIRGTTTDPVEKAMELLPIGPVVIVDTPGLDDEGTLGKQRVERALGTLSHTDIAVLTVDGTTGMTVEDTSLLEQLKQQRIPYVIAWNKVDIPHQIPPEEAVAVSAKNGAGIEQLKSRLVQVFRNTIDVKKARSIFGGALSKEDVIILVTPIDESAPKGRMILPQVQTIREILDNCAICITVQPEQLSTALKLMRRPPRAVVTDSQVFAQIKSLVPKEIPLTSFSILFARYKGILKQAQTAVHTLKTLPENSRILIAEGCTHHRQCNDIGTVKLPQWIQTYTGKQFQFDFSSGNSFPTDLSSYQLVIHCGGCMLSQKEMESRGGRAAAQGVPCTNYGLLIAYLNGIMERSLTFLQQMEEISHENT